MIPIRMKLKASTKYTEKLPALIYIMAVTGSELLTIQDGKVERMAFTKIRQWAPNYIATPTMDFTPTK